MAMLFSVVPVSVVNTTIGPVVHSISMLLVHFVLPFVLPAVCPGVYSIAVHVIILPLADVDPAVLPLILPIAFDLVLEPLSVVSGPVLPDVEPLAMFFPLVVVSLVHGVVSPHLLSPAVLEVVLPVSLVARAVLVEVDAVTVGFVVEPLSFEDIAVDMPELAVATRLIEPPVAFVLGAVSPDLDPEAMLHVSEPLAVVGGSVLEMDLTPLLKLGLVEVVHVLHRKVAVLILVTVVQEVLVLRVDLHQVGSDPLSRHYASDPGLKPDHDVDPLLEVLLYLFQGINAGHMTSQMQIYLQSLLWSSTVGQRVSHLKGQAWEKEATYPLLDGEVHAGVLLVSAHGAVGTSVTHVNWLLLYITE